MNKILLSVICTFALVASAAAQHPSSAYSICELRAPEWTGTGTLIGTNGTAGLILSCRHVGDHVGMTMRANWLWAGRNVSSPAQVVGIVQGRNFDTDLCVLVCRLPRGVTLKSVAVVPFNEANGPWLAYGFRGATMRRATVTEAVFKDNVVMLNAALVPGMSGGPLFDKYGRIVAVNVASDFKSLGVSADGPTLQNFVNQFRK